MKPLRTEIERRVGENIERIFLESSDSIEIKLENFTKYVRRQHLKRFIAMYELFKLILPVKGSVIECGVYQGFGLMAWAKLSAMLEPENLTRRIYGFDTFEGFPSVHEKDASEFGAAQRGELSSGCYDELLQLISEYDADRFLGHIAKVELIKGDIVKTLPEFMMRRQHLVVSLLFLDCDLYEPTRVALEQVLPRMPKGAVVAFDELDNPIWPGETSAVVEALGLARHKLRRFEWDPYIAYTVLE
jgi:macrocin-O-methyltransferase TylF-like protien